MEPAVGVQVRDGRVLAVVVEGAVTVQEYIVDFLAQFVKIVDQAARCKIAWTRKLRLLAALACL